MKDVRFRAWDKIEKKTKEVEAILFSENEVWLKDGFYRDEVGLCVVELMEYTGLKDSKGVEIYEGDIIFAHTYWDIYEKDKVYFEVYYDKIIMAFMIKELTKKRNKFFFTEFQPKIEVVGNIYENPELLENQ